jgi:membrane protein DedA with SNARE-associated domain
VFHDLIKLWFDLVHDWGYLGVVLLMALESSIFPVPSEVVMPPAAFWAAQGRMDFWLVVLAGTAGSYLGSAISYWVAQWVGKPVVDRFGKWFLMPPAKVKVAEAWVLDYGSLGIFVARLLPVVRHLISIPAGILRMPFYRFSLVTTAGAGLWCLVLSWWGQKVLGENPKLLDSPDEMVATMKEQLLWFVGAVVLLGVLCYVALRKRAGAARPAPRPPAAP